MSIVLEVVLGAASVDSEVDMKEVVFQKLAVEVVVSGRLTVLEVLELLRLL